MVLKAFDQINCFVASSPQLKLAVNVSWAITNRDRSLSVWRDSELDAQGFTHSSSFCCDFGGKVFQRKETSVKASDAFRRSSPDSVKKRVFFSWTGTSDDAQGVMLKGVCGRTGG